MKISIESNFYIHNTFKLYVNLVLYRHLYVDNVLLLQGQQSDIIGAFNIKWT